jgi:hypothetical protein
MTSSRKKDDPLSETTKSYLKDVYIKEVFGREKTDMVANKFTQKGIMCETDGLEMIERVSGSKFFKNLKTFENDFIKGTPDVVAHKIIDTKLSWDLFTFANMDSDKARKAYYYQMLGYMMLTGRQEASVIFCLVNTPEHLMNAELYRLQFSIPDGEHLKYKNNYIFDDIPENMRIKTYTFLYSPEDVKALQDRIIDCRNYLLNLSL